MTQASAGSQCHREQTQWKARPRTTHTLFRGLGFMSGHRHNHWEHFTLKFGSKGLVLDLLNLGQGLEDGGGDTGRGTLVKTPAQKSFLPFPHIFLSFCGTTGLTLCGTKKRRDVMWSREKSRSGSEGSTSDTSSSGLVSTSEPRLTLLQHR